ncbi:MAG: sugar ABC transporter ATP-binding protein, partial [Propionibacteriaceae bacterium]|nr:sugar ABC transporter ATP-binding protein [Propionibacteriaceae bacterium]
MALDDVSFAIHAGEVRALLGKNGAGKSTLIKILGGVERPDTGTLRVAGDTVTFKGPSDAMGMGIATVHQELACAKELTVAENIMLGRWPRSRFSGISWPKLNAQAREALELIGLRIPVTESISNLPLAQVQLVEIARAISVGARLLILDEPTSSLAGDEVSYLIEVVKRLADQGIGVIYISHRMDEIERVATSVTVMRDGKIVGNMPMSQTSHREVVELMIGDTAVQHASTVREKSSIGNVILSVRGLRMEPRVSEVSFDLRVGEILGIAGLLGSGRTETIRAIVGASNAEAGEVSFDGQPLLKRNIRSTRNAGIYMTPEDRRNQGAITTLGVDENLILASLNRISSFGVLNKAKMNNTVRQSIKNLDIKIARPEDTLGTLSGGNQQKVVIGKALNTEPKVLLLDEPTRGVDVGAKTQLYDLMRKLSNDGIAIVFVSSEAEELLEVCDRIVVLRNGRIEEELDPQDLDMGTLQEAMMK